MDTAQIINHLRGHQSFLITPPKLSDVQTQELQSLFAWRTSRDPDPCLYLPSSGSSRDKNESLKLIALPLLALQKSALMANRLLEATSKDKWGLLLNPAFIGGLSQIQRAMLSESKICTRDTVDTWKVIDAWNFLRENEITLTSMVPTQLYDFVERGFKCPESLRLVLIGGSHLNQELWQAANELGYKLIATYGQTETASLVAVREHPDEDFHPLPGVLFRLNSEDILEVKAETLSKGYGQIRNGEMIWMEQKDSWLNTGDQFEKTDQGWKYLGRKDRRFKINGKFVNLDELTTELDLFLRQWNINSSAWALEVQNDPRSGHRLVVFFEENSGEFREKIQEIEEGFKKMHLILLPIEKLPRSHSGKVLYRQLRNENS